MQFASRSVLAFILFASSLLPLQRYSTERASAFAPASAPKGAASFVGELLSNGGFEAGDFRDWTGVSTGSVPAIVQSDSVHSGHFAARTGQFLYTKHYEIKPSTAYSLTAWYRAVFPSDALGTLSLKLEWYNASDTYIRNTLVFAESNKAQLTWALASGSAMAPANAAYLNVYLSYFGVLGSYIDLDDVSVIGLVPNRSPLYLPFVSKR